MMMQTMMQVIMLVQAMMQLIMLMQVMMQTTSDGGLHDTPCSPKKIADIMTKYMHEQLKGHIVAFILKGYVVNLSTPHG
jgi:hypothetical protein